MRGTALGTLLVALVVLAGCGDDEATTTPVGETSGAGTSSLDCPALIPDDALGALGWTAETDAEEHAGRCERRVDGVGGVTVGTRPAPDGAAAELAEQCDEQRASGEYVEQPVSFLDPAPADSCLLGLADAGTGVAELLLVNEADGVVQVRVEALQPVDVEQLEAGLQALAGAAADLA